MTIFALSTGPGVSGVAIIRVSGADIQIRYTAAHTKTHAETKNWQHLEKSVKLTLLS